MNVQQQEVTNKSMGAERLRGKVVNWFEPSGYGFVRTPDGTDVFVNWRNCPDRGGRKRLFEGETVEFEVGPARRDRQQAVAVEVIG